MNALISAEELKKIIDAPDVRILDCSYGQPHVDMRIPGALDFDIDTVADPDAILPHTLPSPELFEIHAGALGIGSNTRVIVYDRSGIAMAASRVWWMFRIFGHENVQILDGGLPRWLRLDYPVASHSKAKAPKPAPFGAIFRPELHKKRQDMLDNLKSQDFTVLDARDAKRYSGDAPEPRPGMESGHIPGALSVPYATLIDPETGLFKKGTALEKALAHVNRSKPVAISCGSGVTACVVALGLYQTGFPDAAIYGGSWAEWGGDLSTPKKKGHAP